MASFSFKRLLGATSMVALLLASCGEPQQPTPHLEGASSSTNTETAPTQRADFDSPNVLILLVDTLRADHLGSYGYSKPTSPSLDAFARRSAQFKYAWAQAPKTSPSHASLFSSTYPRVHGVWNRMILPSGETIFPSLSGKATTMAEVFQTAGYQTAAIADGGNVTDGRGFDQGFDKWDSRWKGVKNRVDTAIDWIERARQKDEPFFLFLHTYQVHTPYLPRPELVALFTDDEYDGPLRKAYEDAWAFYQTAEQDASFQQRRPGKSQIRTIQQRFYKEALPGENEGPPNEADLAFLIGLYDAEIRMVDEQFERLQRYLTRSGLIDDTVIVVTSDHGEEFWEHGEYGHHQAYDTTLHVPLIIHAPKQETGFIRTDNVQLFDLMPALLEFCKLDIPESVQGHAFDFTVGASAIGDPWECIAEANWPKKQIAYRQGRRKAMLFPDSSRAPEVYLLTTDPEEQSNALVEGSPLASGAAKKFLARVQDSLIQWGQRCQEFQIENQLAPAVRNPEALSDEVKAELSELGYGDALDED